MDDLMTSKEVADYLKVSEKTLENWRKRGTGPRFSRLGVLIRYQRVDVEQYLENNVVSEE